MMLTPLRNACAARSRSSRAAILPVYTVLQPESTRSQLYEWAAGEDVWLRRSSIICQLGLRERTDLKLLSYAIEASAAETNFFLRKAIGWALRDYARTHPDWVRRFVADRTLSPLSVREATKHLRPPDSAEVARR